jgi:hypothetical protein
MIRYHARGSEPFRGHTLDVAPLTTTGREVLHECTAFERTGLFPGCAVETECAAYASGLALQRLIPSQRRGLETAQQELPDALVSGQTSASASILPWHEVEAAAPCAPHHACTLLGRNEPQETDRKGGARFSNPASGAATARGVHLLESPHFEPGVFKKPVPDPKVETFMGSRIESHARKAGFAGASFVDKNYWLVPLDTQQTCCQFNRKSPVRWPTFDHRGNPLGHAFPRRCACGPPTLLSVVIIRQEFVIFRTSSFSTITIASDWTRRHSATTTTNLLMLKDLGAVSRPPAP